MNKRLTKKKKQELLLKILANKVSELDEDGGKYKARKLHKSFSELKTINRINGYIQNVMRIRTLTHSISTIPAKVRKLLQIVTELEEEYPGRHFTLDGHLVGSIGEVLAEYYYGIHLYDSSFPIHDGWVGEGVARREIQIKTTQRNTVMMSCKPDYLIVLY